MMSLTPGGVYIDKGVKSPKPKQSLGARSPSKRVGHGGAFVSESSNVSGMRNTNLSQLPIEVDLDPLLKDIVNMLDSNVDVFSKRTVVSLYRDMYYHDPIAGSCVDLFSTLPFGDFTLGGVNSKNILGEYQETLERLNAKTLLNELSVDHLVTGTFLSTLLYDRKKKVFVDIMPHRVEDAEVKTLPFYSQDPIIRVNTPAEMREIFNDPSDRIKHLKEKLGPDIIATLMKEQVELDPINTVYIPRKTFSSCEGVSYYRRILPLWLIEKNLFRGTLVESSRRQRGILHLTLGDGEAWEPSVADMDFMTELFMNADADPLGAIIATRQGVESNEMRQGGDFWKVTDIWDSTASFKLRALGISETFLSGDATYSTAEASMTVFIEALRAYRDNVTRKLFYNKIFPLVSLVNGYSVTKKGRIVIRDDLMQGNTEDILSTLQDGSKLLIPTIHWNKQLKPEGDLSYLDMLRQLTEYGVPVPLRAFAAAGGFNLDEILQQKDEDLTVHERILEYTKELADMKKKYGPPPGEGEDEGMFASAAEKALPFLSASFGGKSRSAIQSAYGKPSLQSRDFGNSSEIVGVTKTGKPKHVLNQALHQEKTNRIIAKSLESIAKNKATPLTHKSRTSKIER